MIYSKVECESHQWLSNWFYETVVAFQDELEMKVTDDVKPSIYEIRTNYFISEMIQIRPSW